MGTHISRVKSVDLDAWTDEQLRSVLMWGNARANKYWEAKLAPGHVPSEAKIENFIRTKYESKRWVMDGPIPDPATLDIDGDDDVPLSVVKEKQNIERSVSQRAASSSSQVTAPSAHRAQHPDLFGDDSGLTARPSTTSPLPKATPKAAPAPPKQTKPTDSLLGLDFFGAPEPPNRPASAAAAPAGQSRPDLKQSILSLYATAPKVQPQPTAQQPSHSSHGSFGSTQSPQIAQQSQSSFGRLNDAFSSLSFSKSTQPSVQPQNSKPSAFAGFGNISSHRSTPSQGGSPGSNFGSAGSFFDAKPAQTAIPQQSPQHSRTFSSSSGFGAFNSAPGISPQTPMQPASSSGLGDLFDFSTSPVSMAPKETVTSPPQHNSVFNLSAKPPRPPPPPPQTKASPALSGWNNIDPWGSNEAWSSAASHPTKATSPVTRLVQSSANEFGRGSGGPLASQSIVPGGGSGFKPVVSAPPKVSADEDFGGWNSAAPAIPGSGVTKKPVGGFTTSEDLFSNVWE
jgi:stromal membrane-associated protein